MLSGREQVWRRVGEGHRGEAVQLPSRGHAKPPVPRVTGDGWKRLRTGVPCASCMIPLESRMREIRTRPVRRAGGGNGPSGTAPPPDPTVIHATAIPLFRLAPCPENWVRYNCEALLRRMGA